MRLTNFDLSFFSLFHHDILNAPDSYFPIDEVWSNIKTKPSKSFQDIRDVIIKLVEDSIKDVEDHEIALTLTGGFDSRLILATLLKLNRKPICFAYGDERNRDIQIAREICSKFGLTFKHVVAKKPTSEWYNKWVCKTVEIGQGKVHLHRAHRTAAIDEFTKEFPVKVLFTGHFGGESIRGLAYNNYFSSSFFQNWNSGKLALVDAIDEVLKNYFISDRKTIEIKEEIEKMKYGSTNREERIFYFLNSLVANIHHSQDLQIYKSYVDKVVPIYMTPEFQSALSQSPFHYMRKKNNKFSKLNDPVLYCQLLKQLEPRLLAISLSNGYKPSDFLKGKMFYLVKRVLVKYLKLNKNFSSFKYDQWFIDFVKSEAKNISPEVWAIYDRTSYFKDLEGDSHQTTEGYWHKFSNPIFFDLLFKMKQIQK